MIICCLLPAFAIHLECSATPIPDNSPLVIYSCKGTRRTVLTHNEEAGRMGVRPDMSRSRVRALCPQVIEIDARPQHYEHAVDALCQQLLIYTERIETEGKASLAIWLDVGKCNTGTFEHLGEQIRNTIHDLSATVPQMGIADGRFTARIAALTSRSKTVQFVPVGQEAAFLAPLPLAQIAILDRVKEQWEQLGLKTLSDLARLPYNSVRTRFGELAARLHHLAHGQDRRSLNRYIVPLSEELTHHFDNPIEDSQIVQTTLQHMTHLLASRLREGSLATRDIHLTIQCDDHKTVEAAQTLRQLVQAENNLWNEVLRLYAQLTFKSGIVSLTIGLDKLTAPQPQQLDFLGTLFQEESATLQQLVTDLAPRHEDVSFQRLLLAPERAYIAQRNVIIETVQAA